ncbi:hypothetical protein EZV62_009762 [Acer yangbiense]|uniref:Subtilisin-like protease fibronectin type-III domain-containing protein n=1 Tax=Acer yangbiense TaxID=1000413 RepID=A0A5C7I1F4_9ROSI|nr:hypothetical protein EZV62_009762 [Acer yangbiense]
MMFGKILLFLVLVTTTAIGAAMAKNTYIIHIDKTKMASNLFRQGDSMQTYQAVIDSINKISLQEDDQEQQAELLYAYETAISGFAAKLSTKQLESLKKVDGFLSATPGKMLQLHTTNSQQFLGLQNGKGLLSASNSASDVIIGFLDTGISPEHVSFKDTGMPAVPSRWKGVCEEGTKFSKSNCNKKLIGARFFFKGYEANYGRINETNEFKSARDNGGHGTHTASTAAGSLVANASFSGLAKGIARGTSYTSRIAAYKVCWRHGCSNLDMLAAIDKALQDGVDVLSLSLGPGPLPFYSDALAIASFYAIKSGVFVSISAGNEGPFSSSVSSTAPWMMTVAASYTDRTFPAVIKLGNGKVVEGVSFYSGDALTKPVPVAYLESTGIPESIFCLGTLNESLVKGKIVVCHGDNEINPYLKSENVKKAKGVGMILVNPKFYGDELTANPHILPTAGVGYTAGKYITRYASTAKKPTASIIFKGTVYGRTAPVIAAFSSRGPNSVDPDVIKPDVTAPGVNILAAWPPTTSPTERQADSRSVLFNIVSGTSMSCPHVSGLAALLKSVHRDWSPAAIKSALMTTAYTLNNKKSPISDVASSNLAGPFAYGSGHVDPERAVDPGLIYDIATQDYLNYLCSLNYTSSDIGLFTDGAFTCPQNIAFRAGDLNYPSFAFNFKGVVQNGSLEYKRTVTNVGIPTSSYAVQVEVPEGVSVIVKPKILSFNKLGQKLSYKVTVVGKSKTSSHSSFGSLTWVSGKFRVRSPIAVTWQ